MEKLNVATLLKATEKEVCSYIDDTLPIVVAIVDPKKVQTGISIQRDYPLSKIERRYGVPFGHLLNDPTRFISDLDELHGCKWGIEVHEAVFKNDALNQEFINKKSRVGRVVIALSTGVGNILQNVRTVAYVGRTLFHVVGEQYNDPPPYSCLVEYEKKDDQQDHSPIGVELLLFHDRGCLRVDKTEYQLDRAQAVKNARKDFENEIRWAISGYPLIIGGEAVSAEMTASNASDFRHVWRLPKLQESLVNRLINASSLPEEQKKRIEFYFGFDEIDHAEHFIAATRNQAVTMPLTWALKEDVFQTICSVCNIEQSQRDGLFSKDGYLKLNHQDVTKDFAETGYNKVKSSDSVTEPGNFYIDAKRREITVKFLPAIYPHHIVGISQDNEVINISITGLSGRSGITLDRAKALCKSIGLTDAVIFDNGNDVIARVGGGAVICHGKNQRQTRLTAALHFGCMLEATAFGGSFEGFELAYTTASVTSTNSPVSQPNESIVADMPEP